VIVQVLIEDNFPMALSEAERRLSPITRTPPRLVTFDTTCGQGFIDVFQEEDPGRFAPLRILIATSGIKKE
jgi:hypothetical protein